MENLKKNNLLKTILIFLIVIASMLVVGAILNNKFQILEGEKKVLQEQLNTKRDEISKLNQERLIEREALQKEILYREKQNEVLIEQFSKVEKAITNIEERPIFIPTTLPSAVNYFNTRYVTTENKNDSTSVLLAKNTTFKVIEDLEEGDKVKAILPLKNEQLTINNKIIHNLEQDKQSYIRQISTAEMELKERLKLQELSDKKTDVLNSQLKTLKIKNTIHKWLIPVGVIVGGYIGSQYIK